VVFFINDILLSQPLRQVKCDLRHISRFCFTYIVHQFLEAKPSLSFFCGTVSTVTTVARLIGGIYFQLNTKPTLPVTKLLEIVRFLYKTQLFLFHFEIYAVPPVREGFGEDNYASSTTIPFPSIARSQ